MPCTVYVPVAVVSLPVWEEWIEIHGLAQCVHGYLSLPVWEEWIEIFL